MQRLGRVSFDSFLGALAFVATLATTNVHAANKPIIFSKNSICVALFTTHSQYPGVKSTQNEQKARYDETVTRFDEQLFNEVSDPNAPSIHSLSVYSNEVSQNDLRSLLSHREAIEHASMVSKDDTEKSPETADDTRYLQIAGAEEIAAFLQASHDFAAELSNPIASNKTFTTKEKIISSLVVSISLLFDYWTVPYWGYNHSVLAASNLLDFANGNPTSLMSLPLNALLGAYWTEKAFRTAATLTPFADKKFQKKMKFLEQLSNGERGWYYESTQNKISPAVIQVARNAVPEVVDKVLDNWVVRLDIIESGRDTVVGTSVAKVLFRQEPALIPEVWIDQLISTDPATGTPLLTIRIQTIKKRPAMPKKSKKPVEEKRLMPDWLPDPGR